MESIFTLVSALKGQQRQIESVSNNLANVNTPGYKSDQVVFREYFNKFMGQDLESEEEKFAHQEFISPLSRGGSSFVMPDHVSPSMSQGVLKTTDNPFDLSIQDEGFFVVETSRGKRYTRNGHFLKDSGGYLVTPSGDKVIGKKGAVKITGNDFSVGQNGIILVDGKEIDVLQIVKFPEPDRLTKLGNSYFAPSSTAQQPIVVKDGDVRIQQGVLEGSNVDAVQETVKMININRSYEASQRAIRSMDDLDEKSISIARV